MSRRPGIGVGMMHDLASVLLEPCIEEKMIDVPVALDHGTVSFPLGRFLRRKLRTFVGRSPNAPPEILAAQAEELQALRKTAFDASQSFSKAIVEKNKAKILRIESKEKRRRKEII